MEALLAVDKDSKEIKLLKDAISACGGSSGEMNTFDKTGSLASAMTGFAEGFGLPMTELTSSSLPTVKGLTPSDSAFQPSFSSPSPMHFERTKEVFSQAKKLLKELEDRKRAAEATKKALRKVIL